MGINIILPIIAGVIATIVIGSQVAPSYMENIKIKKVENVTLANQEMVKDAIVRYIKLGYGVPEITQDLLDQGLVLENHTKNSQGEVYKFNIDKELGTLRIYTKLDDVDSGKYFTSSFKYGNKPSSCGVDCIEDTNYMTHYLLDIDTFANLEDKTKLPATIGTKEWIEEHFKEKNNFDERHPSPEKGDKDYIVNVEENKVKEYEHDGNTWVEKGETIVDEIFTKDSNPSDGKINFDEKNRIICDNRVINKMIFIVNDNNEQGELIWVAPNEVASIQTKIFGEDMSRSDVLFTPNQICMSNVLTMKNTTNDVPNGLFTYASNFNQPLDRWDVSNINVMWDTFLGASKFNQNLSSWDVGNAYDFERMFADAHDFNNGCNDGSYNCPLNWNMSKAKYITYMFMGNNKFNQNIGSWDTKNVLYTRSMFSYNKSFNNGCPPGNNGCPMEWDMSKLIWPMNMFSGSTSFNQNLSKWCVANTTADNNSNFNSGATSLSLDYVPKWIKAKVIETKSVDGITRNYICQISQNEDNSVCKYYDIQDRNKDITSTYHPSGTCKVSY